MPTAGSVIYASDITRATSISAIKPADDPRTSLTITADADLLLPVLANTRYNFEIFLQYKAATAVDVVAGIYGPTGAAAWWAIRSLASTAASGVDYPYWGPATISSTDVIGGIGAGTAAAGFPMGTLQIGANPGNFGFRWAPNAAGTATLLAGSTLKLTPIG